MCKKQRLSQLNVKMPQLRRSVVLLLKPCSLYKDDEDRLQRVLPYRSVKDYLLPYLEQALGDLTKAVTVNALDCLAILCKSGFLQKRILLEMIEHAFPLLCYPSQWVRRSVVTFISTSSEILGAIDSLVFPVPFIRPFL
uniref:Armadillo-like helical n=1 Tax=Tanacetum cinerariifolium TaxID=118510 RepID=A0A6L2LHV0_TANCI|nr:armadillo-like helical [Tanacetum cinerariifolium]